MENIELIALSVIITLLFTIFIFGPLAYVQATQDIPEEDKNKYGLFIIKMIKNLEKDETMTRKQKTKAIKEIQVIISDMESDGVYFPESVKSEIKTYKDNICNYSGLPSVESYAKNNENI